MPTILSPWMGSAPTSGVNRLLSRWCRLQGGALPAPSPVSGGTNSPPSQWMPCRSFAYRTSSVLPSGVSDALPGGQISIACQTAPSGNERLSWHRRFEYFPKRRGLDAKGIGLSTIPTTLRKARRAAETTFGGVFRRRARFSKDKRASFFFPPLPSCEGLAIAPASNAIKTVVPEQRIANKQALPAREWRPSFPKRFLSRSERPPELGAGVGAIPISVLFESFLAERPTASVRIQVVNNLKKISLFLADTNYLLHPGSSQRGGSAFLLAILPVLRYDRAELHPRWQTLTLGPYRTYQSKPEISNDCGQINKQPKS